MSTLNLYFSGKVSFDDDVVLLDKVPLNNMIIDKLATLGIGQDHITDLKSLIEIHLFLNFNDDLPEAVKVQPVVASP